MLLLEGLKHRNKCLKNDKKFPFFHIKKGTKAWKHYNVIYENQELILIRKRQCPNLSFYFAHSQGALPMKLCTRKLLHAPSKYIAIINGSKNVHSPGAHLRKSCTRLWKCARQVQGALLISDTEKATLYTEYAGCAITTGIAVKFGTAHGRLRPEVGSTKCIDIYGSGVASRPSLICGTSNERTVTTTIF